LRRALTTPATAETTAAIKAIVEIIIETPNYGRQLRVQIHQHSMV
jgi:hypothetical protein